VIVYATASAYGQALFHRRMRFVDEAALPTKTANKYRALATLRFLADRTGLGAPWSGATASFLRIARLYPRILTHPIALRFIAGLNLAKPRHLQACWNRPRTQACLALRT
jgi:hypothetical protein